MSWIILTRFHLIGDYKNSQNQLRMSTMLFPSHESAHALSRAIPVTSGVAYMLHIVGMACFCFCGKLLDLFVVFCMQLGLKQHCSIWCLGLPSLTHFCFNGNLQRNSLLTGFASSYERCYSSTVYIGHLSRHLLYAVWPGLFWNNVLSSSLVNAVEERPWEGILKPLSHLSRKNMPTFCCGKELAEYNLRVLIFCK